MSLLWGEAWMGTICKTFTRGFDSRPRLQTERADFLRPVW